MNRNLLFGIAGIIVFLGAVTWFVTKPTPQSQEKVKGDVHASQTTVPEKETPMNTSAAGVKTKTYRTAPPMNIDISKTYTATIMTSKGTMVLNLFAKEAPKTVNNFVFLARAGFYNNTTFHRIIKGFMIQGGDPNGDGTGGPGYKFDDEPITRDYTRGTLAMANAGPNTNGSQFFIMHADYALPKNYVIFGAIDPADSASLKTLDAIAETPVGLSASGEQSKPLEPVTVSSVTIEEK